MARTPVHHDKDVAELMRRLDGLEQVVGSLEQRLRRIEPRFEKVHDHVKAIKAALETSNPTSVDYSLLAGNLVAALPKMKSRPC
jgi:hypothetical protein